MLSEAHAMDVIGKKIQGTPKKWDPDFLIHFLNTTPISTTWLCGKYIREADMGSLCSKLGIQMVLAAMSKFVSFFHPL